MKELRKKTIEKQKEKGKKIAAVFPIHYPRELLRAFGYHPVEVWGPPGVEREEGFKHFQPYTCDIVMRGFSFILKRKEVDLILVPHTCDSLQGMASVTKDFVNPPVPVLTLYHPRGRKKEDVEFLEKEIKRLFEKLCEITGKNPGKEELMNSITREEKADAVFGELYEIRDDLNLTDREFYEFLRTREFLPPEEFISMAKSLPEGKRRGEGKKIIISGILPEPMEIFDLINKKGGIVIDDDLACCGRRIYQSGKSEEPFRRMAERILSAPPDPTLGSRLEERIEYLLKKMEKRKADGILIYNPKFCEPELFDFPFIKKELTNRKIKVQFIETEILRDISHQTIQRIDTFLEVL